MDFFTRYEKNSIRPAHEQLARQLKNSTLRLKWPFGKTFILSIVVLALLLGIGEVFVRTKVFQAPLTAPNMGTRHYQFGHKLAQLEAIIEQEGPVNCLFLGNSTVDVGIDPQAFSNAYKRETGQDIQCFNFAIDALPAAGSGAVARILVEEYRPQVLIYGTNARDYVIPRDAEDTTVILDTNWIQYRLGNFTIDGWLLEHSYLYRYRTHLQRLSRFYYRYTLRSQALATVSRITPYGYTPVTAVGEHISTPPDPHDDSSRPNDLFDLLSNYEMRPENLTGLEQIISLNGPVAQVIIVEMPVTDSFFYFFGNGQDDHQRFIDQVSRVAEANDVPFWRTTSLQMIPDDGWTDRIHLNTKGAQVLSSWLGHRVGDTLIREQSTIQHLNVNK